MHTLQFFFFCLQHSNMLHTYIDIYSLYAHRNRRTRFNHPNRFIINSYQYFLMHKFIVKFFFSFCTKPVVGGGIMALLTMVFNLKCLLFLDISSANTEYILLFFPNHPDKGGL